MDEDQIFKKLDKLDGHLNSIDKTLVRHDENLKNHLYRTELLEKQTELLAAEMKPIARHVDQVSAVLKFLGILATALSLVMGILKLLS